MDIKALDAGTVVRGDRSEYLVFELKPDVSADQLKLLNQPATLYLWITKHKEFPPFYRHAWGTAFVSTNDKGSDRFPVESLSFSIEMDSPNGGKERCRKEQKNVAELHCDTKYGGASTFGDFQSNWLAIATHPGYGTWRHSSRW